VFLIIQKTESGGQSDDSSVNLVSLKVLNNISTVSLFDFKDLHAHESKFHGHCNIFKSEDTDIFAL
jgi:hypothetical protein